MGGSGRGADSVIDAVGMEAHGSPSASSCGGSHRSCLTPSPPVHGQLAAGFAESQETTDSPSSDAGIDRERVAKPGIAQKEDSA
jgi:hypothetical protein